MVFDPSRIVLPPTHHDTYVFGDGCKIWSSMLSPGKWSASWKDGSVLTTDNDERAMFKSPWDAAKALGEGGEGPAYDTSIDDLKWQLVGTHLRVWRTNNMDGITWDQLQRVKNAAVGENATCIEVYPPQCALINEANIRHLWVVPQNSVPTL